MIDAGHMTHAELDALLRWYKAMGVDIAIEDEPHDRFAEFAAEAARPRASAPEPAHAAAAGSARKTPLSPALMREPIQRALAASADDLTRAAQEAAAAARTLDELRAALEGFEGCALKRTASRLVFADGAPQARIMLVGEAPGTDEDREGRPFVGRAGRLLDLMLRSIGLDRGSVYIANVVPWRPPGNRRPTPQEAAMCLPFIRRQIELVGPDYLVCLGDAATQTLLGAKEGISRARGRAYQYELGGGPEPRQIRAFAMLHPAHLLRQPANKGYAWADLRALKKAAEAGDA